MLSHPIAIVHIYHTNIRPSSQHTNILPSSWNFGPLATSTPMGPWIPNLRCGTLEWLNKIPTRYPGNEQEKTNSPKKHTSYQDASLLNADLTRRNSQNCKGRDFHTLCAASWNAFHSSLGRICLKNSAFTSESLVSNFVASIPRGKPLVTPLMLHASMLCVRSLILTRTLRSLCGIRSPTKRASRFRVRRVSKPA